MNRYYYRLELTCYFTQGPSTHTFLYVDYPTPFNEVLQEALIQHHQLTIVPELLEHLASIVVSSIDFLGATYDSPFTQYQPWHSTISNAPSYGGISLQWLPEPSSRI